VVRGKLETSKYYFFTRMKKMDTKKLLAAWREYDKEYNKNAMVNFLVELHESGNFDYYPDYEVFDYMTEIIDGGEDETDTYTRLQRLNRFALQKMAI
jgi:hypothetical protein